MYKRILIPTDGSETATLGLREGLRLAKESGAQVRIVHVVDDIGALSPSVYGAIYTEVTDQFRAAGANVLARAKDMAQEAGIDAETQMIEAMGEPAGERIVTAAKEWQADLIVCGTHGRRGLRRIVIGSDAEFIVRHTPVPLLLVRDSHSR